MGFAASLAAALGPIFAGSSLSPHTTAVTDRPTAANVARALADATGLVIVWSAAGVDRAMGGCPLGATDSVR